MKEEKTAITELLSWAAIAGNILFLLWVLYNGANEGFRAPLKEVISYMAFIALLILNSVLLIRKERKKESPAGLIFWIAIAGNILCMAWMTYRRIDENFKGTVYELISYIGLIGLLSATIVLLLRSRAGVNRR